MGLRNLINLLKANYIKLQPHAAGALSCAMMQNQRVGTQGKGFTLVRGAGHGSTRAATGSAHGGAALELECKEFCGKQLYSLSCLGGAESVCVSLRCCNVTFPCSTSVTLPRELHLPLRASSTLPWALPCSLPHSSPVASRVWWQWCCPRIWH